MAQQQSALQQELDSLRQLTMSTMTASADLGLVVQFFKDSFTLPDYSSLAKALIETLDNHGLETSVYLQSYAERLFLDCSGEHNPQAEQRMIAQISMGRLVEDEHTLQVNYPAASILVHNFQFSEERRGQLKDALALLIEGVEARIKSLILAEKEAEAQRSKKEFFALMTHELRTPLNPIIGFSSRLEKKVGDNIDAKHANAISAIKNNAESLLRLLNYFIDVSNLEAGEIAIKRQKLLLDEAIQKALEIAAPIIDGYNTKVNQQIPTNREIFADPIRFTDIIVSLICNAARMSRNSDITIEAEIDHETSDLHVMMKNCGALNQQTDKEMLFESLTSRTTGCLQKSNELGIGLYLTKKLVELHEGDVDLRADTGGTTFHVRIPLKTQA